MDHYNFFYWLCILRRKNWTDKSGGYSFNKKKLTVASLTIKKISSGGKMDHDEFFFMGILKHEEKFEG